MKYSNLAFPALIATVVLSLLFGCSSLNIYADWDREIDFSAYQTYTWIPQDEGLPAEQQLPEHLDLRLRRVVDDIMANQKEFDLVPVMPQADLLFAYYIDTEKALKVDYSVYGSYYGGYGYGSWAGYMPPGYAGGGGYSKLREYTTGTLVLDIVDRRTKTLVWTGVIAGDAKYQNPTGDRIEQVMTKVLKEFPPTS